jgi:hypothetical protein
MYETFSIITGPIWLGYTALSVYARAVSAVSSEAKAVREAASDIVGRAENSKSLFGAKLDLIEQLHAMNDDCANEDWDGYGAMPLNAEALDTAKDLIRTLPDEFPLPECAPEPDGSISLDWIVSKQKLFSLTVGRSDRLAYAWLDGTDQGHAVSRLDGSSLPARILNQIQALVNHGPTTFRAA